jgi:molybdopterin molybdotransferase
VIELEQALRIIESVPPDGRLETVSLEDALGRVLPRAAVALIDSPPFDKSTMDGFAVGRDDDSAEYRVLETIAAGDTQKLAVRKGECARIMTGAPLPAGADRVIRRELTEEKNGIIRPIGADPGVNVIRRGANLKAGQPLVQPKILMAQDIGILAASGIPRLALSVPPVTGIICTGSEIRQPGEPLGPGQVYESNSALLRAQLLAMRCRGSFLRSVEDEPGALSAAIDAACAACEVVLLTGGVSAGDFDYVPRCLQERGAEILFHGVAVKPGKPALFARSGACWIFGLPGNPVSTFVIFEVLVKPFLYRRMGITWQPLSYPAVLAETIKRREADRTEFIPVRMRDGAATPVAYHGSSDLNGLGAADGLLRVPRGTFEVPKGTAVEVRPI